MTTIIVTHEDNQVDEFEFEPDQHIIGIGRRSSNDVCIPNLSVSGLHATIAFPEGENSGDAWIEDLKSTNGTYVNGRLISRQRVNDGDEIILGKVRLVFLNPAAQVTSDFANDAHTSEPEEAQDTAQDTAQDKAEIAQAEQARSEVDPDADIPVVLNGHAPYKANADGLSDEDIFNDEKVINNQFNDDDFMDESFPEKGFSEEPAHEKRSQEERNHDEAVSASIDSVDTLYANRMLDKSSANSSIEDDSIDAEQSFSDDARVFAQPPVVTASSMDEYQASQAADSSGYIPDDDDRLPEASDDIYDEKPMSLSEKAALALGRKSASPAMEPALDSPLHGIHHADDGHSPEPVASSEASGASQYKPAQSRSGSYVSEHVEPPHPLDGVERYQAPSPMHELDKSRNTSKGAIIEIKNGAKSGQILPIDKPVTTLGRPGIQIAAIMRKPDGYFLMHIESDDSVDRPTLNHDAIGDEPVLLHSGDELNVAGIDVEFMLS